jgi:hypothetical protein
MASPHLIQEGHEDSAAAGSDRVPESDRPALWIDPFGISRIWADGEARDALDRRRRT